MKNIRKWAAIVAVLGIPLMASVGYAATCPCGENCPCVPCPCD